MFRLRIILKGKFLRKYNLSIDRQFDNKFTK